MKMEKEETESITCYDSHLWESRREISLLMDFRSLKPEFLVPFKRKFGIHRILPCSAVFVALFPN
jgi:hypothetical protein